MDKKRMIMTKTPLRITFVGGGTDIASYYKSHGPGAVISAAIDKYVYIIVNKKFDHRIRASYSKTEIVDTVDELQHPIIREVLKFLKIDGGIEIVSVSDIPSGGTGLGSSSSFTVGLLNALHSWKGELVSARQLAEEAVKIEVDILKEPIGKQDQYIAALGGMRMLEFNTDESVMAEPIIMREEDREAVQSHLLMLYTERQRSASGILSSQKKDAAKHFEAYDKMRDLAYELHKCLSNGKWSETGKLLDRNWQLKRTLAGDISDEWIDGMYKKAMENGADGGKLIGAGGGGFLLFFAEPAKHGKIRDALGLRQEEFQIEALGSRIIYVGD